VRPNADELARKKPCVREVRARRIVALEEWGAAKKSLGKELHGLLQENGKKGKKRANNPVWNSMATSPGDLQNPQKILGSEKGKTTFHYVYFSGTLQGRAEDRVGKRLLKKKKKLKSVHCVTIPGSSQPAIKGGFALERAFSSQ